MTANKGPVYVQISEDEVVLDKLDSLKNRLIEAKELLSELYEIRTAENKSIQEIREHTKQIDVRIKRIEEEEFA